MKKTNDSTEKILSTEPISSKSEVKEDSKVEVEILANNDNEQECCCGGGCCH